MEFNQVTQHELVEAPIALSQTSFNRFAHYITSELGIKMPESKVTMVQSRLLRRVRELGLDSMEGYAEYFFTTSNHEERQYFINAITTNKTDFFREPAHFNFLLEEVLPSLTGGGVAFKAWSAGCSSGEEPYTLAMVLAEYAGHRPGFDFAVLGTDVSTKMLDCARDGIYQEWKVLPIPEALRRKYLLKSRDDSEPLARIIPELRRKVGFHRLNFMDDDYPVKDAFDVIFFRNVMIYFDRSTQQAVTNKLCRNLAPGGHLFIGHSESLSGLDVAVKPVTISIYRKSK